MSIETVKERLVFALEEYMTELDCTANELGITPQQLDSSYNDVEQLFMDLSYGGVET